MIATSIRITAVLLVVCGILYNLAVTGIAEALMPKQARGSLIYAEDGTLVGSELIGQPFTDPGWFHGRESSIGYAANGSGTPNYAPSNPDMLARTEEAVKAWSEANPDVPIAQLPIDLVSNSGSGLDPHISVAAAMAQVPRVGKASGVAETELIQLIQDNTKERELGLIGEPVVNVLMLNLDLRELKK
ncbi:potassium-transporting ATPase subunit KdpC [Paenibacillus sp. LHD-117]|uniref:potassium-transporting ATPase subunit KdpC n=1 Tax=Paenibacillus sp. LHD-117 TaxID=3071412 RepID=UPI0027E0B3F5|nr:potassium-transporting ATPase subunit KdpC [Paenibacillus sp. LHD-117]MDQ6419621.1 potassium-transporting ATPase subunit KdpC [Paenibacillus sp. LHD-117]